ncbi:hypothetical protein RGV33_26365 [Pseudomonas sp. Bout1]|nr:hypothetical protein [Pseudomonas sp. Bout1]MDY7535158.1 hypothetical protein [Pseudomonas sp. Bout1]MEB0184504.1 hypothetical protein [Pseudomonas sp. Bout1]
MTDTLPTVVSAALFSNVVLQIPLAVAPVLAMAFPGSNAMIKP